MLPFIGIVVIATGLIFAPNPDLNSDGYADTLPAVDWVCEVQSADDNTVQAVPEFIPPHEVEYND